MRRVIVDYKKLTPDLLALLVEKYPDGYDDDHIINFKNAHNDSIEAVEVRTEEAIYLVKVSARLATDMANFDDEDDDDVPVDPAVEEFTDDSEEE